MPEAKDVFGTAVWRNHKSVPGVKGMAAPPPTEGELNAELSAYNIFVETDSLVRSAPKFTEKEIVGLAGTASTADLADANEMVVAFLLK